jgi:hypothetical protein
MAELELFVELAAVADRERQEKRRVERNDIAKKKKEYLSTVAHGW